MSLSQSLCKRLTHSMHLDSTIRNIHLKSVWSRRAGWCHRCFEVCRWHYWACPEGTGLWLRQLGKFSTECCLNDQGLSPVNWDFLQMRSPETTWVFNTDSHHCIKFCPPSSWVVILACVKAGIGGQWNIGTDLYEDTRTMKTNGNKINDTCG